MSNTLSAGTMGLNVSWSKTKIQCLGRSGPLSDVRVQGQDIDSVDRFCYLGSLQDSDGRSGPDILCRLGIAASVDPEKVNSGHQATYLPDMHHTGDGSTHSGHQLMLAAVSPIPILEVTSW